MIIECWPTGTCSLPQSQLDWNWLTRRAESALQTRTLQTRIIQAESRDECGKSILIKYLSRALRCYRIVLQV